MGERSRIRIEIEGVVQGVGFRPWVYRLAHEYGLTGWVTNSKRGVEIEVEGSEASRSAFLAALQTPPPLARIDRQTVRDASPKNGDPTEFVILRSDNGSADEITPVTPDAAICADCLRELFDPTDRRYRYPFITCTHCGPRFSIVTGVPYDRPQTTMASFPLCTDCSAEYQNPLDRRFHAQPIACATCGPHISLRNADGSTMTVSDPISAVIGRLESGEIVAVKGIGGYHLACDAFNAEACNRLRKSKLREEKPFAIMVRDLLVAREIACVSTEAERILESPQAPIVIAPKRIASEAMEAIAPSNRTIGIMLPYSPIHHLLFHDARFRALVMTSGNRHDEPICFEDDDALLRLRGIADCFLVHNRPIHVRVDDSVVQMTQCGAVPVRRSRGYAPAPIRLNTRLNRPVLAVGAMLKHTFALGVGDRAYVSQHIGDLENAATWRSFVDGVARYEKLTGIEPDLVAHDLHPDYLSTQYAEQLGIRTVPVQHHHAHIASCVADAGYDGPVIGLAFDGTGYGDDGTLWGGEWLLVDGENCERVGRLRTLRLPGGENGIREPWRIGASMLETVFDDSWRDYRLPIERFFANDEWSKLRRYMNDTTLTPATSAVGRLFDGISAIAGVRGAISYEGQAAIEFEQIHDIAADGAYPFVVRRSNGRHELDWEPMVHAFVDDLVNKQTIGAVSTRFHRGLATVVADITEQIGRDTGITACALSGGVFQNALLLELLVPLLRMRGCRVLIHREVPPNDGGVSLGQLVIAGRKTR